MMKQAYETYEFYENSDVIRLCSLWRDQIDGKVLRNAVNRAMKRYPYLKVRFTRQNECLMSQPNPHEVPVYAKREGLKPLGSEENGYHLVSVDYEQNVFSLNVCHAIADGSTANHLLRTIAYAYVQEAYAVPDFSGTIRTPESELLPGENDTPVPLPKENEGLLCAYESGSELPDSVFGSEEGMFVHLLHLKESEVIAFCKKNDLSPNAFVSVFCAKTIDQLLPHHERPIVCNINQNYGTELGYRNNRHDLVMPINIVYPSSALLRSFSFLGTVTRGQMILKASRDYCVHELNGNFERIGKLDALPTLEEKFAYGKAHARKRDASGTFIVSYPGRTDLGLLSPYLTDIVPMVFHRFGIAVDAMDGSIRLAWHQKGKGGALLEKFIDHLRQENIEVTVHPPMMMEVPGVKL